MKRILLLAAGLIMTLASYSQIQSIGFELIHEHADEDIVDIGVPGGSINFNGYKTWRLYAYLTNPDDFVTSITGDENGIVSISTDDPDATWFHHVGANGVTGPLNGNNFATFPALEYDSYVTIGHDLQDEYEVTDPTGVNTVCDQDACWMTSFGMGDDVDISTFIGGAWFSTPGNVNGVAGDDLKVSLGQFTTNSEITANLCVVVFPNGIQPVDGDYDPLNCGLTASTLGDIIFGCMDPTALNYNSLAEEDDGSCIYPCEIAIATVDVTDPSCFGYNDGSIVVSEVTDNQGSVLYSLDNEDFQANPSFSNLIAGEYTVYVLDNQDCAAQMDVTLDGGSEIVVALDELTLPSCNGLADGEICVMASGGTAPYFYGLSEADLANQNTDNCFGNLLGTSTYSIFVQDANGCIDNSDGIFVAEPAALGLDVNSFGDASCGDVADGCVIALASGGTGVYTYEITGVLPAQSENELCGLLPGEYMVTAIDENGCAVTNGPATVDGPEIVGLNLVSLTDVSCAGGADGEICVSGLGGDGLYLYQINECDNFIADDCFGDLAPGTYTICAQSSGCTGTEEFTIGEPDPLTYDVTTTIASSGTAEDGGACIENVDGGTGDVSITWDIDGELSFGTCVNDIAQNVNPAADYTVTVEDDNGCSVETTVTIDFFDNVLELDQNIQITMFPNPTSGLVNINVEGLNGQKMTSQIVNTIGETVSSTDYGTLNGLFTTEFDLEKEADGIYFITLTVDQEQVTYRVVKN